MTRGGFLARLFAAPLAAMGLSKAAVVEGLPVESGTLVSAWSDAPLTAYTSGTASAATVFMHDGRVEWIYENGEFRYTNRQWDYRDA